MNNKINILVADDTLDNLRVLIGILTEQGYKVRAALNGELALSSVRARLPDLITGHHNAGYGRL